jgi:hypothetical protein
MLHVAVDSGHNGRRGSERAFDECAAQPTASNSLDATDSEVALGDFTDLVGRSIGTVVVDDYDFERMPVQRGLHGVYQSDDILDFIERRYNDGKLEVTRCPVLRIFRHDLGL